jgi:hypothetical protein
MVEVLIMDHCERNGIMIPERGSLFDENRRQPVEAPVSKREKKV